MSEKIHGWRSIFLTLKTSEQHVSKRWADIFWNFGRAFSVSNLKMNHNNKTFRRSKIPVLKSSQQESNIAHFKLRRGWVGGYCEKLHSGKTLGLLRGANLNPVSCANSRLSIFAPESIRGMGISFQRNDFWGRLGGQTSLMIGQWMPWMPLTNNN